MNKRFRSVARAFLLGFLATLGLVLRPPHAPADDPPEDSPALKVPNRGELTDETERAVQKALAYLAGAQNPDGSWSGDIGYKLNLNYARVPGGANAPHVGVTSLACMAFMAGGSLPGRGPHGQNVEKGLAFVLSSQKPGGYISRGQTRMYSHAFATLFLAEVYGATQRSDVRKALVDAVNFIMDGQNSQGAWRYAPKDRESDMSITVCQVVALRAARNAGVRVNEESRKRAIGYIERVYIDDSKNNYGTFKYQDNFGSRTSFALTAAGVTALHGAGEYNTPRVKRGLNWLSDHLPLSLRELRPERRPDLRYFYGHYYAAQAMFHSGDERLWKKWIASVRRRFLRLRRADGTWRDDVGKNYATAMAALILQMPKRLLPIFQK